MFSHDLVRSLAFFRATKVQQLLAERMKCESFGSYGGRGNSAIFLLTDRFISQQSAMASLRLVTPWAEFCGVTLYNA